jgi:lipopolysaccharide transport system ATP-binding protein
MFIRLAFAVSTSINPEILLIDEVMGAGDIRFAAKAKRRMFEFMEQGKILIFASHSHDLLTSFCKRTIWLENGQVRMDGETAEVLERYVNANLGCTNVVRATAVAARMRTLSGAGHCE